MKPLSIFFFILMVQTLFAQAPAGFKYQAVIRDAGGEVKANASIVIGLIWPPTFRKVGGRCGLLVKRRRR